MCSGMAVNGLPIKHALSLLPLEDEKLPFGKAWTADLVLAQAKGF